MAKETQQQKELRKLDADIKMLKESQSSISIMLHDKLKKHKEIQDHINKANPITLSISDHALVRYMQRVLDFDTDSLKQKIITEDLLSKAQTLGGNGKIVSGDKTYVLQNNLIITIM